MQDNAIRRRPGKSGGSGGHKSQTQLGGEIVRNFSCACIAAGAAIGTSLVLSAPAVAADMMPVKAPPKAVMSSAGGVYVWMDGSYQSINLPAFALGWRTTVFPSVSYGNYANSFNLRPTGYGISGGIGYVFQNNIWPSWMGRDVRIEIGGSYIQAKDKQSSIGPNVLEYASQAVNGVTGGNRLCAALCHTNAQLQTDYDSWRINGKIAGDHIVLGMAVTPSMTLFGGRTNVDQRLSQTMINNALGPLAGEDYIATSALHWTDWGAKVGLDATVPLGNGGLAWGLGGNVGLAHRNVSLSASNQAMLALPASTLNAEADKGVFLANAETSLIYRPSQAVSFRAFVGLNYDNDVPGIQGPVPPAAFLAGAQATPASIKYEAETSYYAGGGLTVKFGP